MTPPFLLSLSGAPIGRKVEQRFGLIGLARLLKLVELVIARADPSAKRVTAVVAWGDFATALQCKQSEATDFLTYCDQARVIDQGRDGERLRLTFVGELAAFMAEPLPPEPCLLLETEQQWAYWFANDLNCPPYLRNDPATRALFRRWCAVNVTVREVELAAVRAVEAKTAPHPAILHDHIRAIRQEKISAAG